MKNETILIQFWLFWIAISLYLISLSSYYKDGENYYDCKIETTIGDSSYVWYVDKVERYKNIYVFDDTITNKEITITGNVIITE